MWFWERWEKEFKEANALALSKWESEKNELCLVEEDIYIRGKLYNVYSLGYCFHTLEIFSDLVPTVLDIMKNLLKDYVVFTHVFREFPEHMQKWDKKKLDKEIQKSFPAFSESYAAFLKAHNCQGYEYFTDDRESLVTITKGVDIPTLKAFYDIYDGANMMHCYVYGFLNNPREIIGNDCASITDFLLKEKHDVLMLYEGYHIGLYIHPNSKYFEEDVMIRVIKEVCKKHGKNISF